MQLVSMYNIIVILSSIMNKNNNEIKNMTYIKIVNIFLYYFLDQPIYPGTKSPNGIKDTPGIYINNCCPKFVLCICE